MPKLADLASRAGELLELCRRTLGTSSTPQYSDFAYVDEQLFAQLRTASLSFIELVFGAKHTYYTEFSGRVRSAEHSEIEAAYGILTAVRDELAGGWLQTTRGLVSAEVFSDFLEMADHFLGEGYKDPAAVMIGGVLEERLRQLAAKHGINSEDPSGKPMKADKLNADLARVDAYNKLEQKQITGWLDLRNKAAHAKYKEYDDSHVSLMLTGVRDFLVRCPV